MKTSWATLPITMVLNTLSRRTKTTKKHSVVS